MNRQEQRELAAFQHVGADIYDGYFRKTFVEGALWADEHPREGLWDKEKVIDWLQDNLPNWVESYKEFKIIEDLCNAMMDENTPIIDEKKAMEKLVELKNELLR